MRTTHLRTTDHPKIEWMKYSFWSS